MKIVDGEYDKITLKYLKDRLGDIASGATGGTDLFCQSEECGKGCMFGRRRFRHAIAVLFKCGDIPDDVISMGIDHIAKYVYSKVDWSCLARGAYNVSR